MKAITNELNKIEIQVRIDYSEQSRIFYATTNDKKPTEHFSMSSEVFENSYLFKIESFDGFFLVNTDGYCCDNSCFHGCCDIVVIEGKNKL